MSSLDSVLYEISKVQTRLNELSPDAFLQRIELRDRLNELRAEAGDLRLGTDAEGATPDLLARLANAQKQRAALKRSRVNVAEQGADALLFTPELNRSIERGLGLSDLDEKIEELKQILSDRGVDVD